MATTTMEQPPQAVSGSGGPPGDASGRGEGQSRRRRGGRARGRGGRGRGGRDGEQQQPTNANGHGHESGQSANVNVDDANKKGIKRRPRRRGRGGGGRGNEGRGGGTGRGNDSAENDVTPTAILDRNAVSAGAAEQAESPPSPRTEQAMEFIANSLAGSNGGDAAAASNNGNAANSSESKPQRQQQQPKQREEKENKKKKRRNRTRRKEPISAPWRKFIPPGLDDPISLEPLNKLPYPPFAIVVESPYIPVLPGMWPPPPIEPIAILSKEGELSNANEVEEAKNDKPKIAANVREKDRDEMEILKDQWGDGLVVLSKKEGQANGISNPPSETTSAALPNNNSIQGRHVNLFDGRVLAYYLVSTLQFIDPFNRRNLTRPELQALDAYLAEHKLGNAGVVEAYDDKGVSVSTASADAQTSTGRAEILQQEARSILGSLYRGPGGGQQPQTGRQRQRRVNSMGNFREDVPQNSFQRMYAAQGGSRNVAQSHEEPGMHDTGIYEGHGGGGLLIIDDDINPGLRGGVPGSDLNSNASTFYSARHIAEHHGQEAQAREGNFPSLAASSAAAELANIAAAPTASKKAPPTGQAPKSLSKISKLVKKTDPKQLERQRKAREDAKQRAEFSKLDFFNPDMPHSGTGVVTNGTLPTAPAAKQPPSEGVLERNRNLAMALGVAPSTIRNAPTLTGWARPVTLPALGTDGCNFGNELNAAQYPDALLAEAKERMMELLKVEKQWKKFLADDRAASCSLKPMARPLRKFVHEYGDFWKLKTESFDPEGRRYIQCGKLVDTCAPYPMLSEAARKWRGPPATAGPNVDGVVDVMALPTGPKLKEISISSEVPSRSDGWRTEQRVPLKLAPRTTTAEDTVKPPPPSTSSGIPRVTSTSGMTRSTSTPLLSMTGEVPTPARFADLHAKERPRLQLTQRSIPTWDELENRKISQEEWNAMTAEQQEQILCEIEEEDDRKQMQIQREKEKEEARVQRMKDKERKKRDLMVKKQAILESAFASSSDDDGSSGSDWFEGDLEFDGSDDEGM